jgi:hypothetical protein
MAVKVLGKDRYMPIYYWSKNRNQRKTYNIGSRLPDYNLEPPEDEPEHEFENDKIDDYVDIDVEEINQRLGLHS